MTERRDQATLEAVPELQARDTFNPADAAIETLARAETTDSIQGLHWEYANFDIEMDLVKENRLRVTVAGPKSGGFGEIELSPELYEPDLVTGGTVRDVKPRSHDVNNATEDDARQALRAVIGRTLVPAGKAWDCFSRIYENTLDIPTAGLRLRLYINDRIIASIPWEAAWIKEQYIGRRARFPILRHVQNGEGSASLASIQTPWKWLGVICHPNGPDSIDCDAEKNAIEMELKELEKSRVLSMEWLIQPTAQQLRRLLWSKVFHIIHFIGHGTYDHETGKGCLVFINADGSPQYCSVDQVVEILLDRGLKFAFLNACSTGHEAGGLAEALVQKVLPAAVGMRRPVEDRVAINFAKEFYRLLGLRYPIDAALSEARLMLSLDDHLKHQWSWPVLYSRAEDGKIL